MKECTELKTAIVDGPITPELFTRLESMGFEIVDMNDAVAMEGLRKRLEIELVMRRVHDATGLPMIDLRHELSKVEQSFDQNPWPTSRSQSDTSAEINFVIHGKSEDPIQPAIIKKEGSKFFDGVPGYSRHGRARNQGFSKHFKHS